MANYPANVTVPAKFVTVAIRNPVQPELVWEGEFLIDTRAMNSVVPRQHLESIRLVPKSRRNYKIADGSEIVTEVAGARIEFLDEVTWGRGMLGVWGICAGQPASERPGGICAPCRRPGKAGVAVLDDKGKPVKPEGKRPHATPREKGTAVDMYFDGVSYRRTAENIGHYFGRETSPGSVYAWVRDLGAKANDVLGQMKVSTGDTWVADEMVVNVGGKKF